MEIGELVHGYRAEILDRLGTLVSYNSTEGEALEDAPFGKGPRDVLRAALHMLEQDGIKTVNLDNYIGYGEIGEGDQVIGVIGHLDVVPANKEDGWNTDPFQMVEKDGILYGRGVSDDKGAVVASMIALKVLKDMGIPLTKKIRLIMGTNEETGSKCLAHYVEKEGSVDYGFTPDGEFPLVYGEKGMIGLTYHSKSTGIIDIFGGHASNIVCPKCYAKVKKCSYSSKKLADFFNNNSIDFTTSEDGDVVTITVIGKAAHASTPELGVNAISMLLTGLKEAGFNDPFVNFYCSHYGTETDGTSLGLNLKDEYGALTLNNGMISMKDGVIEGTSDIRFPVTMTVKQVLKELEGHTEDDGGYITVGNTVEPLFFPLDSPLVSNLLEAYQETTGDYESKPLCIGGGTYAKGIHNTIAFGCAFAGNDYRIHDANEWVRIEELEKQAVIYVNALIKLLAIK